MACYYCDDDADGVADREALADFVSALLVGDVPLARILAARAFTHNDAHGVENVLARAAARKAA